MSEVTSHAEGVFRREAKLHETSHVPNREDLALHMRTGDWAVVHYPDIGTVMIASVQSLNPLRVKFQYNDTDKVRVVDYDRQRWLRYLVNSKYLVECGRIHETHQYTSSNH